MDSHLTLPLRALRVAFGLTATLAGLDKFFNILADWGSYVSPGLAAALPVPVPTLMAGIGLVEIAVGLTILFFAPKLGAYVASAWLLLVSVTLAIGGFYDIAVRDVVMSLAAFTLARGLAGSAASFTSNARSSIVAAGIMTAVVLAPSVASAQSSPMAGHHATQVSQAEQLRQTMRDLWTDHVVWTRAYVVAALADQPDAHAAATRLLKNQEHIGAAVAGFYGKAAGDRLTALLKDHILIAVDVVKAAKSGDKAGLSAADAKWKANGDDIAAFLSSANPNWPRATLQDMMRKHLSTTTDVVVARLNKQWDADVRAYDIVYDHILAMADALSDGIIKQFPAKFTK
jgi:hypothetical protein